MDLNNFTFALDYTRKREHKQREREREREREIEALGKLEC